MLAFNNIGSLGRLGNQMFEYAALRGIAAEHGYDFMIPPPERGGIENYSLHQCFKLDHIKTGFIPNENYSLEQTFHFINDLLHEVIYFIWWNVSNIYFKYSFFWCSHHTMN